MVEHLTTKLSIVKHHNEPECHAKRVVYYFQGQDGSNSSHDQNMTVSVISSEMLILFATRHGLIVHYHKPECGEIGLLCSKSRSQQNFKMLMNVCRDDIL